MLPQIPAGLHVRYIPMTLEFFRQIFEKHSNIKFNENPSSGSRGVTRTQTRERTDRQTDRHVEANGRTSQFRKRA